jgi:hypothetical protein
VLLSAIACICAVDQRHELAGRGGGKLNVLSMSRDPLNTQYIATGSGDALGERERHTKHDFTAQHGSIQLS